MIIFIGGGLWSGFLSRLRRRAETFNPLRFGLAATGNTRSQCVICRLPRDDKVSDETGGGGFCARLSWPESTFCFSRLIKQTDGCTSLCALKKRFLQVLALGGARSYLCKLAIF